MADPADRLRPRPGATRRRLSFSRVNRKQSYGHDPGLQRHHLVPLQIARQPSLVAMLDRLSPEAADLDDFRTNGMLLPCREPSALRLGLPLHRGPHPTYNELVFDRVGQIEREWSRTWPRDAAGAITAASMRLSLLQRALRRFLLGEARRRLRLNRRDPLPSAPRDYADLDAVADALWSATEPPSVPPSAAIAS